MSLDHAIARQTAKPGIDHSITDGVNDHDPVYLQIRDLIYRSSGIYQTEDKTYLLASRCARRMKALAVSSPADYLAHLTARVSGESELRALLNEITIGETYMFRNPFQLHALQKVIIPQIQADQQSGGAKHLRIWSAGCSTGEEPYTLAIQLLEDSASLLKGWTFEVVATDINDHSLETARAGIYGDYALRNTTTVIRSKYFHRYDDKRLQVNDQVKTVVHFDRLNLSDERQIHMISPVHVIFCCNVLIYFDLESKRRVIQHFYSKLRNQGYLFLGHAESLFQIDSAFHLVHFSQATGYCKRPAAVTGNGTL